MPVVPVGRVLLCVVRGGYMPVGRVLLVCRTRRVRACSACRENVVSVTNEEGTCL